MKLNKSAFPLSEISFFYVKYKHNNEVIAKKIKGDNERISFDETDLFKIDGVAIPTSLKEMTLYYENNKVTKKIGSFTPVFADTIQLKKEMMIFSEEMEDGLDSEKKMMEINTFLNEFYGKPLNNNLSHWLSKSLILTQ